MSDTYAVDPEPGGPGHPQPDPPATDPAAAEEDRPLFFPNVGEWVTEWLLPHYRRNPAGRRWDPQWWRYEEAGSVLEALWESWEQMRWEDARAAVAWYRDCLWPVMDQLTSRDGPFWDYDPPRSADVPAQWEATPAPPGWF
jgi:hypothetical protein